MNRRHFLTASAFAGTWSLMHPFARAAGSNDELRIGMIGFRSRGKDLLRDVMNNKRARVVALCDVDSGVLEAVAADLEKKNLKIEKYDDYRKLCESKDIDAVIIATPNHTHALIATTAAANGKHVYVEKPVSHNVWEGRELTKAAAKHRVIIQHGFQRRSETGWQEAAEWIKSGEIGKMTLARGFCYKPRKSIGKVPAPVRPPSSIDYNLWSGPREMLPVRRGQFHYDWHWQFPYGNGDLGNQGPHQLDVCRWFVGDPVLPESVLSVGGRFGDEDDGDWANTQVVWYDYKPVPILFEVRGLPKEGMEFEKGMDRYKGQDIGNVIECEGGWLSGGHGPHCVAYDKDGKKVREFNGGKSHAHNFIDSVHAGKIDPIRSVESGHLSSALAHIGNISWRTGQPGDANPYKTPAAEDAYNRMILHLEANNIDTVATPLLLGRHLTMDPKAERFTGEGSEKANALLKEDYRKGFELVV